MIQKTISKLSLLALTLMVILSGCADKTVQRFTANIPIYQSWEEFHSQTITIEPARPLSKPGKIYLYNQYLLVNDFLEGIHIFDNSNPSSPVNLGFLPVLANVDMAVSNNILYVDNYTDLLAFDFTNPAQPVLVQRVNDVFTFFNQHLLSGYDQQAGYNHAYPMVYPEASKGIVIGWKVEEIMQEQQCVGWCGTGWYRNDFNTMDQGIASGLGSSGTTNVGGIGIAGSLARFAITQGHLYVLENWSMTVFSIVGDIQEVRQVPLNINGETLFPADGFMYIGSSTGMGIYSLQDPANPTFITIYTHVTACDPVVVQGNYAYVTLRTGNTCEGNFNLLEVVDITNKANPSLVSSFEMTNPRGLGVDGNTLFLCDGPDGLKIFDKTDHATIPQHLIGNFTGIEANDVIPHNEVLIMTAAEGIYQYSYTDPTSVTQLSLIPVQN
jgi:hypothetical protein